MKEIEYTVKRLIHTLPVVRNFVAFKEERVIAGEPLPPLEGISIQLAVDATQGQSKVPPSEYILCDKKVRDIYRTQCMSQQTMRDIRACQITEPYSYIAQNGLDNVELLKMSWADNCLYDMDKVKLPGAVYFDYIDGAVTNANYDLTKLLAILRERNDITLLHDGITKIPDYNATEDVSETISFVWVPSDKDWDRVKASRDTYVLRERIMIEIILGTSK